MIENFQVASSLLVVGIIFLLGMVPIRFSRLKNNLQREKVKTITNITFAVLISLTWFYKLTEVVGLLMGITLICSISVCAIEKRLVVLLVAYASSLVMSATLLVRRIDIIFLAFAVLFIFAIAILLWFSKKKSSE